MTKEEFKKLAEVSGGVKFIENWISGETQTYENPDYEEQKKKRGFASLYLTRFVPFTYSDIFSTWMVGLEWKGSDGCLCYAWFTIYNHDHEMTFHLKEVYKPGPGKKMRRDAAWNLMYKMMQKAKLV